MTGRADLHGLARDVHARELHELVVHRGQATADELGRTPRRDIEEDATVGAAASGLDFSVDRARDLVAGEKFRGSPASAVIVVPLVGLFF